MRLPQTPPPHGEYLSAYWSADLTGSPTRAPFPVVACRAMPRPADRVADFAPITLDQVSDADLMRRIDRKFLLGASHLPDLLDRCLSDYRILEVRGNRLRGYLTRYFDTPDLALYSAHHAGRLPRSKVRTREYLDTGERYLEVKRRVNTGRADKSRLPIPTGVAIPLDRLDDLAADLPDGFRESLREVLTVAYTRITLVHRTAPERMTVDIGLRLTTGERTATHPSVAFIEVKQSRWGGSPSVAVLRALGAQEGSISKYCLGVVSLMDGVRTNLFKEAAARVHRIGAGEDVLVTAQ